MSKARRLIHLARRGAIIACIVATGAGLCLVAGIAVTTDVHTGQEQLNGVASSAPLLVPLLLLLGGGAGLILLAPHRPPRA